ncbi:hypothetical protein KKF34_08280 [Myxococcota bacterium]|nr:hypothetical protein [Myxococcota bacterium]MBU1381597.1 hypothetical protein [Myxococcota bacterium]MBU1496859.1 hypothetical protein [Myxococcota bacterium]
MPSNALKANIYYGDILLGSELEVKDFSLDKFIVFYNEPMPVATDLIVEINSDESPVKGSAVVIKAVEGEKDNTPFMEIRWVEIADENIKVLNSVAEKASAPEPQAVETEIIPEITEPETQPSEDISESNEETPDPVESVPDVEDIDTTMKIDLNQESESESNEESVDNEASTESENSVTGEESSDEPEPTPEPDSPVSDSPDEIDAEKKEDDSQAPEINSEGSEEGVLPDSDGNGEEKPDDSKVTGDGASEDDKPVKKKVRRRTKKS